MGCAQSKSSENSPSRSLEKLKSENGYSGKPELIGKRRSSKPQTIQKDPNKPHRRQPRNYNGFDNVLKDGEQGKKQTGSERVLSSKSLGEDEVINGWPKWLADNVPSEVLAGVVQKTADSYDKLAKVGQGTYSNVYKARDRDTGKIVALKKVRVDISEPESIKFMAREIMILQKLDHPNVVKLEGLATSRMQWSLYLVFDFMQTDLSRLISCPETRLTEPQIKCYMQHLLSGLRHCHDKGILHRDIKASNLLIDKNGMLKIADFGLANYFRPKPKRCLTNRVVTLWYRAPELLLGSTDYGVGIDLWSAGCLFAEMFAGKPILPGRTEVEQLHRIFKLCGTPSEEYWRKLKLASTFRPPQLFKPSLAETFRNLPNSSFGLLSTLLALDPAYRGSASMALQNEFFYTEPLACELSGLPVVHSQEDDDLNRSNKHRRHRTSVTKRRSTYHERRKKDPTSAILNEKSVFFNEELRMTTDSNTQSDERGSTTTSTTSSGVNRTVEKESPLFLPSPVAFPSKMSSRTSGFLDDNDDISMFPGSRRHGNDDISMFPSSRRQSSNFNDGNVEPRRVRRSESHRELRNWNEKDRLKHFDDC